MAILTDKELDALHEALETLEADIHEKQKHVEQLKDMIKHEMEERGTDTIEGTGWRATWRESESSRFDSAAFKAEHKAMYARYLRTSTVKRFTINAVKN